MSQRQVRHVKPVPVREAEGELAAIYRQIRRDYQAAPPLTLLSPVPGLLTGLWSALRESQLVDGKADRPMKEAVSIAVSDANSCPYCVDAHAGMLQASGRDALPGIVQWGLATRTPGADILRSPPFSSEQAPEIIGTAVVFHFVNRMVNVFLSGTPLYVPTGWTRARKLAVRLFAATAARSMLSRRPAAGDSLQFLPTAEADAAFSWALPNPVISAALAGFSAAAGKAGRDALPEQVRDLVGRQLSEWQGGDMGPGRRWADEAVAGLDAADRPAARLALLTALAPQQVDDALIAEFRATRPGDAALVGATGWAAFTAARRIGSWLSAPVPGPDAPA